MKTPSVSISIILRYRCRHSKLLYNWNTKYHFTYIRFNLNINGILNGYYKTVRLSVCITKYVCLCMYVLFRNSIYFTSRSALLRNRRVKNLISHWHQCSTIACVITRITAQLGPICGCGTVGGCFYHRGCRRGSMTKMYN